MRQIGILAARVAAIPDAIERLLARGLPTLDLPLAARRWSVTAAGIAEGPARFLVQLLGARARFVPLSVLALGRERGDVLVVFSQGLSPNARIALEHAADHRDTILFTSARGAPVEALARRGVWPVVLEPEAPEDGMLLRVLGPAVARTAALCFARAVLLAEGAHAPSLALIGPAVRAAAAQAAATVARLDPARLLDPLVIVAQGRELDACRALAWKWMEGLWTMEPPVWDVLQFAHGPLQAIHGKRTTLLALIDDASSPLFDRLERVLDPEHHTVVRATATLPGPLAVFEHDVAVNALLVAALMAAPRELARWPGRDADGALYDLAAPLR